MTNAPVLESKFIKELVSDKHGVMVTDEVNFSHVTVGEVQEKVVSIRYDFGSFDLFRMLLFSCVKLIYTNRFDVEVADGVVPTVGLLSNLIHRSCDKLQVICCSK